MNGPKLNHCPHGKDSTGPGEPTDLCPDCKARKCQHGYNMDKQGRPILCSECPITFSEAVELTKNPKAFKAWLAERHKTEMSPFKVGDIVFDACWLPAGKGRIQEIKEAESNTTEKVAVIEFYAPQVAPLIALKDLELEGGRVFRKKESA